MLKGLGFFFFFLSINLNNYEQFTFKVILPFKKTPVEIIHTAAAEVHNESENWELELRAFSRLCQSTHFATEESISQRHIHDSNSTCVSQPVVLKWNQAPVFDRGSESFPCPVVGNMLRAEHFTVWIPPGNISWPLWHHIPRTHQPKGRQSCVWSWLS